MTACAAAPRYPVDTEIGFEPLRTRVETERAARFLREFRPDGLPPENPDPDIAALERRYDARDLDDATLRALAAETSTDFATAYFMARILAQPRHREMHRRFAEALARLRTMDRPRIEGVDPGAYTLAFVPGLFFRSLPGNGAAMEGPRAMLRAQGFEVELVPIGEADTVEANARIVADYLEAARGKGRKVILISTSKGSADIAHAIGYHLAGRDLRHVRGWVSVAGTFGGSPIADRGLAWPENWVLGATGWLTRRTLALARSISTAESARRMASCRLPGHLQVLHYVSAPFSGSVSQRMASSYRRLRRFGPNDGVTLLPDQVLPQGRVVLAVGLDHAYADPEIGLRALAMTRVILGLVDEAAADD